MTKLEAAARSYLAHDRARDHIWQGREPWADDRAALAAALEEADRD